jgi:hypothetical protein
MPTAFEPPGPCPTCGQEVPAQAKACPGCGACPETGWSEAAVYDALDLPDQEFDYEAYVAEEFGGRPRRARLRGLWWIVAIGLALLCFWVLAG